MNLPDLRTRLQDIICTKDIDGHPSAIENLRSEFPHTIQLVERTNPTRPCNCYEWAFDLSSVVTQWVGDLRLPELFAGLQFVSTLIPYLNEIPESDVKSYDLVLYFDEQIPTHAGLATESRVISKWGEGHIYKHGFLEVPSSYGNEISFYRNIPSSVATTRYVKYVRTHPDYGAIQELFEEKFGHAYPR
jgi:hypothetical protein